MSPSLIITWAGYLFSVFLRITISVTLMALHHMAGSRGTLRQVLEGPTVHCRDIDAVLESIRRIKSAGSHKLQVKSLFCGENVIFG